MTDRIAARQGPGGAAGVTEPMISAVVHRFYDQVRTDPDIGPIFNRVIPDAAWPAHLAKLCDFWSSVLLMSGRFKGSPMAVHVALADLQNRHFVRWLQLFRETVEATCPTPAAELFVEKSEMIAKSLQLGLAVSRGDTSSLSERLRG